MNADLVYLANFLNPIVKQKNLLYFLQKRFSTESKWFLYLPKLKKKTPRLFEKTTFLKQK